MSSAALHDLASEVLRRIAQHEIEELKIVAEKLALACQLHVCRLETHTMTFTSSGSSGQVLDNTGPTLNFTIGASNDIKKGQEVVLSPKKKQKGQKE